MKTENSKTNKLRDFFNFQAKNMFGVMCVSLCWYVCTVYVCMCVNVDES